MRGIVILVILLGFPVLEIFTLVRLADVFGWWLLLWLLIATIAGALLLRDAGFAAPFRLLQALQSGQSLGISLLYGFVPVIAGILLIFPGVISDVIAIILLLMFPPTRRQAPPPQDDGVIEGEWHKMDETRDRLK